MRNEHTARSQEPTLVMPVSAQAGELDEQSLSGDSAVADTRSANSEDADAMTTENAAVPETARADGEPPEAARVTALEAQLAEAAALYRDLALAAHPEVPAEMVAGATPQELAAAKATVAQVRQRLAAQAAAERVPAGAPARRGMDPASLTARGKIAYGLSQRTE